VSRVVIHGIQGASWPHDLELRPRSVELFLASLDDLTEEQARAKFRAEKSLCRWNAETQGALLRGIRARYAPKSV
jgi:hypothetical protein